MILLLAFQLLLTDLAIPLLEKTGANCWYLVHIASITDAFDRKIVSNAWKSKQDRVGRGEKARK